MPSESCRHMSMVRQIAATFQYWRYLLTYYARVDANSWEAAMPCPNYQAQPDQTSDVNLPPAEPF